MAKSRVSEPTLTVERWFLSVCYPKAKKQTQNLASSLDRGRTWTKYAGNPVLDLNSNSFRDPKVFWHTASSCWIMATVMADERKVRLWSSKDLKTWEKRSDFGPAGSTTGVWECPALFEAAVEGGANHESRWVLKVNVNDGAPFTFVLHDAVVEGVGAKVGTLSVVLGIKREPGGNFVTIEPDGTRIPRGNLRPKTHLVNLLLKDLSVKRSSLQPGAGRCTKPSLADLKKGTRIELAILVEDDRLLVNGVTIEK